MPDAAPLPVRGVTAHSCPSRQRAEAIPHDAGGETPSSLVMSSFIWKLLQKYQPEEKHHHGPHDGLHHTESDKDHEDEKTVPFEPEILLQERRAAEGGIATYEPSRGGMGMSENGEADVDDDHQEDELSQAGIARNGYGKSLAIIPNRGREKVPLTPAFGDENISLRGCLKYLGSRAPLCPSET